jgi:hypothetical protein
MAEQSTTQQDQKYDPAIQGERRSQSSVDTIFKSILDSQSYREQIEWAGAFYDQQEDHLAMLTKSVQRGRRITERTLVRQQAVEEVVSILTSKPELVQQLASQLQPQQQYQDK